MFAVEDIEDVTACTPMVPNSFASWSSTRTDIGSVTSAALGIIVANAEQLR